MSDPNPKIRVLAVDDHPLLLEGVAALIADQADIELVGEASSGREAVEKFRRIRPDVTLMDMQLPDISGIDAIIAIRAEFPTARIIALTTYAGDVLAQRALKAGAKAYILKSLLRKELLDAIHAVHLGGKRISPDVATQIASYATDEALTGREVQILARIAAGNSNKMIAVEMGITEDTVKGHVKSILAKLGASDRTHAVTLGIKRGIIEL